MNELFRLLPKLLKEFDDNEKLREAVVFAAWRKIAGETLSERAVPLRLEQKRLTVAVANERWTKYLLDLSGQMIFKLNSALGQPAVTFIEFEINEKFVAEERAKRGGIKQDEEELKRLAMSQISPKLRAQAHRIKDEDLRRQFLLAAGGCLARKERLKSRQ